MSHDDQQRAAAESIARRRPYDHRTPLRPVGSFAAATVAPLVRQAPFTPEKLTFAWRAAVGPTMDRASVVSLGEGGRLDVRAATEAWRREIERSEALIRDRLAAWLGDGVVRSVRVTAPEVERKPRRRQRGPSAGSRPRRAG